MVAAAASGQSLDVSRIPADMMSQFRAGPNAQMLDGSHVPIEMLSQIRADAGVTLLDEGVHPPIGRSQIAEGALPQISAPIWTLMFQKPCQICLQSTQERAREFDPRVRPSLWICSPGHICPPS